MRLFAVYLKHIHHNILQKLLCMLIHFTGKWIRSLTVLIIPLIIYIWAHLDTVFFITSVIWLIGSPVEIRSC